MAVELRAPRAPHHLQHVGDREVDVALQGGVVELGALDDDEVRRRVDAPRERRGRDEDLAEVLLSLLLRVLLRVLLFALLCGLRLLFVCECVC